MYMKELRDLYDKNGNKTDKTYYKGEDIPKGYYPMVVMVVIRNSKGEFLMQKRTPNKGGCHVPPHRVRPSSIGARLQRHPLQRHHPTSVPQELRYAVPGV